PRALRRPASSRSPPASRLRSCPSLCLARPRSDVRGGHARMRTMQTRQIVRLGRSVSVVGLGTWQLGADWGDVSPEAAHEVLEAAVSGGVTFFDTADVYGDGRSERF